MISKNLQKLFIFYKKKECISNDKLLHNYNKFMIYSYRIEHAMKIDMLKNINKNLILIDITHAVDMHRQAMKLVFDNVDEVYKNI
jgi:hypothetical protein